MGLHGRQECGRDPGAIMGWPSMSGSRGHSEPGMHPRRRRGVLVRRSSSAVHRACRSRRGCGVEKRAGNVASSALLGLIVRVAISLASACLAIGREAAALRHA